VPHGLDDSVLDHENHSSYDDSCQRRLWNVVKARREVEQGNDDYDTCVEIGELCPHATGIEDGATCHASIAAQSLNKGIGHVANARGD